MYLEAEAALNSTAAKTLLKRHMNCFVLLAAPNVPRLSYYKHFVKYKSFMIESTGKIFISSLRVAETHGEVFFYTAKLKNRASTRRISNVVGSKMCVMSR